MEQTVPYILTRDEPMPPMSLWGRVLALVLASGCLTMLSVGVYLTPDRRGVSTHTQLGLQPCQFEIRTSLPCPSCGYTTSVSHFVHGNFLASIYLQPMGFVIALLACVTVWAGLYVAFTGRPVYRLLAMLNGQRWLMTLLVFAIASWGWKIYIHLSKLDHWP